ALRRLRTVGGRVVKTVGTLAPWRRRRAAVDQGGGAGLVIAGTSHQLVGVARVVQPDDVSELLGERPLHPVGLAGGGVSRNFIYVEGHVAHVWVADAVGYLPVVAASARDPRRRGGPGVNRPRHGIGLVGVARIGVVPDLQVRPGRAPRARGVEGRVGEALG